MLAEELFTSFSARSRPEPDVSMGHDASVQCGGGERTVGFFVATVPSLPGCHTQACLLDPLMDRVPEAIELTIELEGEPAVGLILARLQPG